MFNGRKQNKKINTNAQLSGKVRRLSSIAEGSSNGREEEVEIDFGQVDDIENYVQRGDLGLIHIIEVLLGKVGKRGVPQNDRHQHDATEESDSLRLLEEFRHVFLAQNTSRESFCVTVLVVDVTEVQLVDWGQSLAATTRGEVGVAGPMVEHPDSDPNIELTASTNQQVYLTGIKRLSG